MTNPPALPATLSRPDAQAVVDALNLRLAAVEDKFPVTDADLATSAKQLFVQLSSAATITDYGLVTALPGSPATGDRCTYKADATNGIFWQLVYDGSGSYPWKKVGGPPLYARVSTSQDYSGGAAWGDVATSGPSIVAPLAGDYRARYGASGWGNGHAQQGRFGVRTGSGAPPAETGVDHQSSYLQSAASTVLFTGLAASTTVQMRYLSYSGTVTFQERWLEIDPVRVG